MTRITTILGDLTTLAVDAIVNAANSSLLGGGGVDGAIHRTGGPTILEECRAIVAARGPLETGRAVVTTAGELPSRHVIHTVGPVFSGHDPDAAAQLLASCYTEALDLAVATSCTTVAFPNISTGVYGYPKPAAARVAIGAVHSWVDAHPDVIGQIIFVCFDEENHELYREAIGEG